MSSSNFRLAAIALFLFSIFLGVFSEEVQKTVIGIDLGTTYCCVAVYRNGRSEIISHEGGVRTMPSFIAFDNLGTRLIGEVAKAQASQNPESTVFDVKRLIGRRFTESSVQDDIKHFPFVVSQSNDNKPKIRPQFAKKAYYPEEFSAMLLSHLRHTAEQYLKENISHAVITVPAYFTDGQRQATKDAGFIAGLNVLRIINEPTAAAIAYGLGKTSAQKIVVFDLGGGTFDVSVLSLGEGVFEVISTNGNTHLGGEDFDRRLVSYFIEMFEKENPNTKISSQQALQRLKMEAERVKIALSSSFSVEVDLHQLVEGIDFEITVSRAKFEELIRDLIESTLIPLGAALEDGKISKEAVDEIVLIGGSTRIPCVQHTLRQFFKGRTLHTSINPDEAVAHGAAIQGQILSGNKESPEVLLLDVAPLTLGVSIKGGIMRVLIPRNTAIPTRMQRAFTTTSNYQKTVTIKVYEGERRLAKYNHLLNTFTMEIPEALRGSLEIIVTFEVDANGILQVSAFEKSSGVSKSITIKGDQTTFSQQEVQKMLDYAQRYEAADECAANFLEAKVVLEKHIDMANGIALGDVYELEDMPSYDVSNLNEAEKGELDIVIDDAKLYLSRTLPVGWDSLKMSPKESEKFFKKIEKSATELREADVSMIESINKIFSEAYTRMVNERKSGAHELPPVMAQDTRMYSDDDEVSKEETHDEAFGEYDPALDAVDASQEQGNNIPQETNNSRAPHVDKWQNIEKSAEEVRFDKEKEEL